MLDEVNSSSEDDRLAKSSKSQDDVSACDGGSSTMPWFIGSRFALVALLIVVAGISMLIGNKYDILPETFMGFQITRIAKKGLEAENNDLIEHQERLVHWLLAEGIEKTCWKIFAYHFEDTIVSDWNKYDEYVGKYKTATGTDKADFLKNENGELIKTLLEKKLLDTWGTHFKTMTENGHKNLIIYSKDSPEEVVKSIVRHIPKSVDVEVEVFIIKDPVSKDRGTDMLLSLIQTKNLEWYEVFFILKANKNEIMFNAQIRYTFEESSKLKDFENHIQSVFRKDSCT